MKIVHLLVIVTGLLVSSPAMASEVSAYDSCIHVKNAPIGSILEIYSVVGIKVKEIKIKESNGEYPVNIPKGYYIIRIGETVRKIVIR